MTKRGLALWPLLLPRLRREKPQLEAVHVEWDQEREKFLNTSQEPIETHREKLARLMPTPMGITRFTL